MKITLYIIAIIHLLCVRSYGQQESKVNLEDLDAYFQEMVTAWDVPSASIGIVKDGEVVFTGNYGYKDIANELKPNKQTLYAIASNSKAFTSTLIGMLVQEGKVDWDDKVQEYLPYFQLYDPWVSSQVTVRDILCHRVGLGTFSGDNIWYKSTLDDKDIIKRIKAVPQAFEFRSGFGYSNLMYITAGELIETITGKSWGANIKERILDPLKMTRTIYSISELSSSNNYATPYGRTDEENYELPWANWDRVAATGGLISNVEDISKWMIFNLNHGIVGKDTLINAKTRNTLWTPHNNFYVDHTQNNDFDNHFSAYGLGWGLSDFYGNLRVSHTGGYDGMISAINLIPDQNLGVVVLTNGHKSPIMAATYYALEKFLEIEDVKDWSQLGLDRVNKRIQNDTRIKDRIANRVLNTKPIIDPIKFVGSYYSEVYGDINIIDKGGKLRLLFSHTPQLSATLSHWHYDVWKIEWDHPQAWFSFGTVKINTNHQGEVIGFDFDIPNDDFFFAELKPKRVNK